MLRVLFIVLIVTSCTREKPSVIVINSQPESETNQPQQAKNTNIEDNNGQGYISNSQVSYEDRDLLYNLKTLKSIFELEKGYNPVYKANYYYKFNYKKENPCECNYVLFVNKSEELKKKGKMSATHFNLSDIVNVSYYDISENSISFVLESYDYLFTVKELIDKGGSPKVEEIGTIDFVELLLDNDRGFNKDEVIGLLDSVVKRCSGKTGAE